MKSVEGANNWVVFRYHELFGFEPIPRSQRGGDVLLGGRAENLRRDGLERGFGVVSFHRGSALAMSAPRIRAPEGQLDGLSPITQRPDDQVRFAWRSGHTFRS